MDTEAAPRFLALGQAEENPYRDWSPLERLQELERLRAEYIQWKYPNVEQRLQRVARVIQRQGH